MYDQAGPSTQADNVVPCFMPEEDCVSKIVEWIESAKNFINVQAYRFTSKRIADALIKAKRKGVNVEVLIDKDAPNKPENKIKELLLKGISISIDDEEGAAHNKVMIIDDERVITGSYNWTDDKYYYDSDVLLFIRDVCVKEKFKNNYNFLKLPRTSSRNTTYPFGFGCLRCSVPLSDIDNDLDLESGYTKIKKRKEKGENFVKVDVCFSWSNGQDCIRIILKYIEQAQRLILIQACTLTHKGVTEELIRAHKRKVIVNLLIDKKAGKDKGQKITDIVKEGIPVKYDAKTSGIAHSKVIIIDDSIVLIGSLNMSYSGQKRNSESLVYLKNNRVNKMFKINWIKRYQSAKVVSEQRCVIL